MAAFNRLSIAIAAGAGLWGGALASTVSAVAAPLPAGGPVCATIDPAAAELAAAEAAAAGAGAAGAAAGAPACPVLPAVDLAVVPGPAAAPFDPAAGLPAGGAGAPVPAAVPPPGAGAGAPAPVAVPPAGAGAPAPVVTEILPGLAMTTAADTVPGK